MFCNASKRDGLFRQCPNYKINKRKILKRNLGGVLRFENSTFCLRTIVRAPAENSRLVVINSRLPQQ